MAPLDPPPAPPVRRYSPFTADAIVAAILTITLGMLSIGITGSLGLGRFATTVTVVTSLGMPAALAWRRTRPVASAVTVYAMALAHVLAGMILSASDLAIFIALYSITVYGPRWARRTALFSALFGCLIVAVWFLVYNGFTGLGALVGTMGVFGLLAALVLSSWALALVRRARVERVETLAERAARLEVERDQQAQIATQAERARIAREMHDIVAHSLSVVIAQADGGRYAAAHDPQAATHALTTISETGRAALADMRKILGVLRSDTGGERLTPQPETSDLETLVEQVRDTGLAVSLVRMGTARTLPPGAGLTVYRIVQESLTNILKHAGPDAHATVLVQWNPAHLLLQIDDDGRGAAAPSDGAGHGLLGMRERAAMLGGTLTTGPRQGGGFRVRAEIPVPHTPPAPTVLAPGQHPPPPAGHNPATAVGGVPPPPPPISPTWHNPAEWADRSGSTPPRPEDHHR
ncbi:sensor histidine kinase [Ruania alba]|uniref:histidine kinase n=1 Tax=Ruania alba TaxID=648782 RepID=A0A1H5D1P2_9MICO|nr:sensor histidine kinase [Ruania alba]SED72630.1 Signal transduction histidine kinase [Ruania alba]